MSSAARSSPPDDAQALAKLQRRWLRERAARREAEAIAERATSDLYSSLQELRAATALTELLGSIAVAANETDSLERALAVTLERVCNHMAWPVGHALLVAPDRRSLSPGGIWRLDGSGTYEPFVEAVKDMAFPAGIGLPGRVLASGEPAAIPDLAADANFPRAAEASAAGLRAGFAFPVLVRSDVQAVLEFFSTEDQAIDPALLRVMGQVGAQLGRVCERQQAESTLTHQALHDPLTGLPNRALLAAEIAAALGRPETRVSLLFIDVDDFKSINDSLSHAAGDQVLTEVAQRFGHVLAALTSRGEAVTATAARFAGDEFAMVLEGCDDPAQVAELVHRSLERPIRLETEELFVTVSIGGATAAPDDEVADLLRAADLAMHEAKRDGKRHYQAFVPRLSDAATRRHQVAATLRSAITAGQFAVHYQPELDVLSGRPATVEALVRWRHPERGLVAPAEFIGVAEDTGLIVDIGRWVLDQACSQAQVWAAAHPELDRLTMAVNVSGRQLRDPDFGNLVAAALRRSGLEPQRLRLEITETVLADDLPDVELMLLGLRDLGVRLAIDDFGTGSSSLATLRRLPVQVLKIDRSFVANVPDDDDAGSIVWTITSLGRRLGMQVVAKGVETAEQQEAVRGFGCDLVQGYHCCPPAPAEDLLPRLLAGVRAPAELHLTR